MSDDNSLLNEFIEEANEHLHTVDVDLLHLEKHGFDAEVVDRLFRSVHSIKGVSGFLDLRVIGTLSHAIENIFSGIRAGEVAISQTVLDILLEATRRLQELVDEALSSNTADIDQLVIHLEQVLAATLDPAVAERLTQTVHLGGDPDTGVVGFSVNAYTYDHLNHPFLYRLTYDPRQLNDGSHGPVGIVRDLLRVGLILDGQAQVGGPQNLREGLPTGAEVHLLFATDLVQEMLTGFVDLPADQVQLLRDRSQGPNRALERTDRAEHSDNAVSPAADGPAPEELSMETDSFSPQQTGLSQPVPEPAGMPSRVDPAAAMAGLSRPAGEDLAANGDSERRTGTESRRNAIKVDGRRLDHLLDLIGELVIAEAMVCQAPQVTASQDPILAKRVSQLDKITRELQEMGTGLRMVPVRSCFQRMARLVRDMARKLDKPVELEISGEETELDKNVVERIADPLVHMLRNAIDHGLEDRRAREAAGKTPTGRVDLRAYHKAGYIFIEVEDDGGGLDRDAILRKAVERDLVAADAQLDDREVYNLIFEPGFSTAAAVTDISGRGVGMDVVRRNIEELRGQVDITSAPGRGSCFSVRLPLTMAIIDGMTVRVAGERFVIPTTSIVMTAAPRAEEITRALGRGELWQWQERNIPLYRLDRLFGLRPEDRSCPPQVVVVEEDGRQAALAIDELCDQQQVVIKPLGSMLQGLPGITGGAVMPDGRVGLILETSSVLQMAELCAREGQQTLVRDEPPPEPERNSALDSTLGGKYLAFRLGEEQYGIRILSAQEIIGLLDITPVPWTADFIRGVINLRGKVIPVVDLRRRFGLETDQASERCIMVVQVYAGGEELVVGIIIDQVPDVHQIDEQAIEEPPPFCSGIDAHFVLGVAKVERQVLLLLDSDRLLQIRSAGTTRTQRGEALLHT